MADKINSDAEGEIEQIPALVPPGVYRVMFSHWWTGVLFGRSQKLALVFKIADFGDHFETEVRRWYNVKLRGRSGRNGRFSTGWGSDLLREYATIVGKRKRRDRIALTAYGEMIVLAEIATVDSNRLQEKLPEELHYSVIRRLIRAEEGKVCGPIPVAKK